MTQTNSNTRCDRTSERKSTGSFQSFCKTPLTYRWLIWFRSMLSSAFRFVVGQTSFLSPEPLGLICNRPSFPDHVTKKRRALGTRMVRISAPFAPSWIIHLTLFTSHANAQMAVAYLVASSLTMDNRKTRSVPTQWKNVTSLYRDPFNLSHSTFCASYVSSHISLSLSSTIHIGHVLK